MNPPENKETHMTPSHKTKLVLGQVFLTQNARATLHAQDVFLCLSRHSCGDWGHCDTEDWETNQQALLSGGRILSVYHDRFGTKFWIITEANRLSTTVLLPEDY